MHPQRHSATLLVLRSQVLFAVTGILVKLLSEDLRPLLVTAWLMLIGPCLGFVYCWLKGELRAMRQVKLRYAGLRALFVTGNSFLSFYGYSTLPLAEACILTFLTPLFLTVLSWAFLKEKVGWHRWGATIAGLVGVIIIMAPSLNAAAVATDRAHLLGQAAMLVAALCNASSLAVLRARLQSEVTSANILATGLFGAVIAIALCYGPLVSTPLTPNIISGLLLLATVAALAVISNSEAYQRAEASYLAPFGYVQLFWITLGGYLIWGDWPGGQTWIGAALIMGGGIYTIRRERYWERRRALAMQEI